MADKYTIIRSVTTMNKPGDHARAPFYWLTGNPRLPSGTDEYPDVRQRRLASSGPARPTCRRFAMLGKIDVHINNAIAPSFLGPAHSPFIFDPVSAKDDIAQDADAADGAAGPEAQCRPAARPSTASCGGWTGSTRSIEGLDQYQQTAFDMLRSPKLREAMDLSKETAKQHRALHRSTSGEDALSRRATPSTSCWRGG